MTKRLIMLSCVVFLIGCSLNPPNTATVNSTIDIPHSYQKRIETVDGYHITTIDKISPYKSGTVRIYIEGDGSSWSDLYIAASDPTPKNPLALKLALKDNFKDIIYIARPCQFSKATNTDKCNRQIWTSKRYSVQNVKVLNEVINKKKQEYRFEKIELIGFSGGGTIAALIAQKRKDIHSIRTVSGNLDTDLFAKLHNTPQFYYSKNPINIKQNIDHISQIHFVGQKDTITPPLIASSYRQARGSNDCVRIKVIEDLKHSDQRWVYRWNRLLTEQLKCKNASGN